MFSIIVKLKNDDVTINLKFDIEKERDDQFEMIKGRMGKVTLDIWYSDSIVIKITEISYIRKE